MKRFTYFMCGLMVLAAMTSCNSNEPVKPGVDDVYMLSVEATKGPSDNQANSDVKRILSLSGSTLNATWAKGEQVIVFNVTKYTELGGYLEAETDGVSTTLSGSLTGTIEVGDKLWLKFLSPSYDSQDGTLEYISTHCDYAEAYVTVASVTDGAITITEPSATFTNKQAIVKFTLKKKADDSNLPVTSLTVSDGIHTYTVTPASATNVLFVALPATNTVILKTDIDGYRKTNDNLIVAGKYYEITVKMSPRLAVKHTNAENYSVITANTELLNGDIVTGTLFDDLSVSIAPGATVTLSGVTIKGGLSCAGITCQTNATITLAGTNTIQAPASCYPGILVGNGTLTINGSGSLAVVGGDNAAGIGSSSSFLSSASGNIRIEGGAIDATGGSKSAAIGCGAYFTCGTITITNTVTSVTARKGADDAPFSIGAAASGSGSGYSSCGTITIGGTVYWDGSAFQNDGATYLATNSLTYTP